MVLSEDSGSVEGLLAKLKPSSLLYVHEGVVKLVGAAERMVPRKNGVSTGGARD